MTTVRETLYDVVYDDDGVNGDRDALGRITKKTEWIVSGDTPNGDGTPRGLDSRTYDYGYNQEGRPWLESVAVDGSVVSSYSYDDNGNRTSVESSWSQLGYDAKFDVSLGEADTEYDSADKLLTYGSKSYAWNNFGQLESMTDSDPDGDPGTSDAETTFYQYDLFGNLLRVDLPDGRAIEYDVDGAGRRVGRRELDAEGVEISFRGWIYRDLLSPAAEVDAQGNVLARYVYRGSMAPKYIELLSGGTVFETLRLVADDLGSVRLVVRTSDGEVLQRNEYDDFGRVLVYGDPTVQPFGYAGSIYEPETGLLRFGARDYDPSVGRWTTRDAMKFVGLETNLYLYVDADPINFVDPWGYLKLPPTPDGLGPDWTPDPNHRDPNGERYRHPSGGYLDFHRGRPGAPGWRGRDHWHDSRDPNRHNKPGDEIPDFDPVCAAPMQSSGPSYDPDPEPSPPKTYDPLQDIQDQIFPNGLPLPFFPIIPVPAPNFGPVPMPMPVPA